MAQGQLKLFKEQIARHEQELADLAEKEHNTESLYAGKSREVAAAEQRLHELRRQADVVQRQLAREQGTPGTTAGGGKGSWRSCRRRRASSARKWRRCGRSCSARARG